jgi:two-component system, LytTR family, response regulator
MKALIIDDERLARKELSKMLAEFNDVEILGEASNAEEAKTMIAENDLDVLFLDIQMPGKSGFELLAELDAVPEVIFVTAYDEFALQAFKVSALDYLMKPLEHDQLSDTLERLRQRLDGQIPAIVLEDDLPVLKPEDQIFLKDGEKCWFVKLEEVRLFESEGNYVRVFFQNHKPLILRSLNNLEDRLDPRHFFRANRKYILNLAWIDQIEPWFNGGLRVTLKDGKEIEVSRRQATRFRELMSL